MANLDTEEYRQILLAKEQELAARIEPEHEEARRVVFEPVHDRGDESVLDEEKEVEFTEVNADWEVLNQVRDALQRIHGLRDKARQAYVRIAGFLAGLRVNAEQLDPLARWYRILSEALRHFLHGRQLQPPLRLAPA